MNLINFESADKNYFGDILRDIQLEKKGLKDVDIINKLLFKGVNKLFLIMAVVKSKNMDLFDYYFDTMKEKLHEINLDAIRYGNVNALKKLVGCQDPKEILSYAEYSANVETLQFLEKLSSLVDEKLNYVEIAKNAIRVNKMEIILYLEKYNKITCYDTLLSFSYLSANGSMIDHFKKKNSKPNEKLIKELIFNTLYCKKPVESLKLLDRDEIELDYGSIFFHTCFNFEEKVLEYILENHSDKITFADVKNEIRMMRNKYVFNIELSQTRDRMIKMFEKSL